MPIIVPPNFPAIDLLCQEGCSVDVASQTTCNAQLPTLRIALLNLMPIKVTTEMDFIRVLSSSPCNIAIDFVTMASHTSTHTPQEHLDQFYITSHEMMMRDYDGCIITGAPVEMMPFEAVDYWYELTNVMDWATQHVSSTLYICWGAQAALYHWYGIQKQVMHKKLFGIFAHRATTPHHPLLKGFDGVYNVPHSRHTTVMAEDIEAVSGLTIISQSDEAGVHIVESPNKRDFFITGHSEYAPLTLHNEYRRDQAKGLESVELPKNYYTNNDDQQPPLVTWRAHAHLLFNNWINNYLLPHLSTPKTI